MKTAEDLNRLIRDEIATIEALRSEDEKIWDKTPTRLSQAPFVYIYYAVI